MQHAGSAPRRADCPVSTTASHGAAGAASAVHEQLTDRAFDAWLLAATFFVAGTPTVRGVANLVPALVACEKLSAGAAVPG